MYKHRYLLYAGIFVIQLSLSFLLDDPLKAGLIVFGIFLPAYLYISLRRHKARVALLDDLCDPDAFIEATWKQYDITGKNKRFGNYLKLDVSAGLASAGRFEEAWNTIEGLDEVLIMKHHMARHVMAINKYVVLRGLGRDDEADEIIENALSSTLINDKRVHNAINMARLDYELHHSNLEACHALVDTLKGASLSKRYGLNLSLMEASMAMAEDNGAVARKYLEEVIEKGNKLHIVKVAEDKLKMIDNYL